MSSDKKESGQEGEDLMHPNKRVRRLLKTLYYSPFFHPTLMSEPLRLVKHVLVSGTVG